MVRPSGVTLVSDSRIQVPTKSLAVWATAPGTAIPRHAAAVKATTIGCLISFLALWLERQAVAGGPERRKPARVSGQCGRHRERFGGIHHEHDERGQIRRAAVEDLHCHAGHMSVHGVTGLDIADAAWRLLPQFPGDDVEGLGAKMRMDWCLGPRRAAAVVDAQQVLGRG